MFIIFITHNYWTLRICKLLIGEGLIIGIRLLNVEFIKVLMVFPLRSLRSCFDTCYVIDNCLLFNSLFFIFYSSQLLITFCKIQSFHYYSYVVKRTIDRLQQITYVIRWQKVRDLYWLISYLIVKCRVVNNSTDKNKNKKVRTNNEVSPIQSNKNLTKMHQISSTSNSQHLTENVSMNMDSSFITSNMFIDSTSHTSNYVREEVTNLDWFSNNNQLISWGELSNSIDNGRKYLADLWVKINLVRTAKFINDKNSSSITLIKKLYERFAYLTSKELTFPEVSSGDSSILPNNLEVKYDEDRILFEETALLASKETYYLLFEGATYKHLDEFGAILMDIISYETLTEDFPIRALGADRFIVGFNTIPPIEQIIRRIQEYKVTSIPSSKIDKILNKSKEKTSGIIYFMNNKLVNYIDIQTSMAKFKPEVKKEIKRILVRKDMFILFVSIERITTLMEQLKYVVINNFVFKSTCNLLPEYHNDVGKLILENCPLNSPLMVRTFLVKILLFNEQKVEKIYQLRRVNNSRKEKNLAAYLIWIRGSETIKKALLSVIDYYIDKRKVGFFKWPKSKDNLHPLLTNDLV